MLGMAEQKALSAAFPTSQQTHFASTHTMAAKLLTTPMPPELKQRILSEFWGVTNSEAESSKERRLVERYHEYYTKQVHLMLYDGGQDAPTWTHNDVFDIMTRINNSHSRQEISSDLQTRLKEEDETASGDTVDRLIDLSARLCVMTSFGHAPFAAERQTSVPWTQGNAKEVLYQHFTQQRVLTVEPRFKLPKIFTAHNIHRMAGLKIVWTPYLNEHLQLLDHDESLAIFHHIDFLNIHRKRSVNPTLSMHIKPSLTPQQRHLPPRLHRRNHPHPRPPLSPK
jgi:hypothetical protein